MLSWCAIQPRKQHPPALEANVNFNSRRAASDVEKLQVPRSGSSFFVYGQKSPVSLDIKPEKGLLQILPWFWLPLTSSIPKEWSNLLRTIRHPMCSSSLQYLPWILDRVSWPKLCRGCTVRAVDDLCRWAAFWKVCGGRLSEAILRFVEQPSL